VFPNFRDFGMRTLIVGGSSMFHSLDESVNPPVSKTIKLEDMAATLASFPGAELHPLLTSILPLLFASARFFLNARHFPQVPLSGI
jgi:hypothetical protein